MMLCMKFLVTYLNLFCLVKCFNDLLRPTLDDNKNITFYIGGLFDLDGYRDGFSELTAVRVAEKLVNRAMENFSIKIFANNSECDPGVGTDELYDFFYRKPHLLAIIGSACSDVTETLAQISPHWNTILISHASVSPTLSNRKKFPTFFRLAPTESTNNIARAMFVKHFSWDTVAIIYEYSDKYFLSVQSLADIMYKNNITIKESVSFERNNIRQKLEVLKTTGVRIIFGVFSDDVGIHVLCEAYKMNLFGSRFVWILNGLVVNMIKLKVVRIECSKENLEQFAENTFTISSLHNPCSNRTTVANVSIFVDSVWSSKIKTLTLPPIIAMLRLNKLNQHLQERPAVRKALEKTIDAFMDEYKKLSGPFPISPYAYSAFDTVWTIAFAIDELQKRGNEADLLSFAYKDGMKTKDMLMHTISTMTFQGLSGTVQFSGPDKKGVAVIMQYQGSQMKSVAMYDPDHNSINFSCKHCSNIKWKGNTIPRDETMLLVTPLHVDSCVFVFVCVLASFGIVMATVFFTFNISNRKLRFIKLSSPKLNNVIVGGCILVYCGVLLLGINDKILTDQMFRKICIIRAYTFAIGFSLSFGSMFTKTYRVHQIFTHANAGIMKSKLLKDQHLLVIVAILLMIDIVVLSLWVIVDPMYKQTTNLTAERDEESDTVYVYQITKCQSVHMEKWLAAIYAFKGLLLAFGGYMAWETRNVKIPLLNDSRYIGMNVYNVVIMSVIVVAFSNILSDQPTLAVTMETVSIVLSTSVTLCLLFIPKVYSIMKAKGDPMLLPKGMVIEERTRRFIMNDKKELQYRAKVQNRAYKREIIELEQEIIRIERLLKEPVRPYPVLSEKLLYSLPETAIDQTPGYNRKRTTAVMRETSFTLTDSDDVCYDKSDESSNLSIHLTFSPPQIQMRKINRSTEGCGPSSPRRLDRKSSSCATWPELVKDGNWKFDWKKSCELGVVESLAANSCHIEWKIIANTVNSSEDIIEIYGHEK